MARAREARRERRQIDAPVAGRESIGRTILVIEEQPYLWAALRQRMDPGMAYVRSATPDEVPRVWRTCQPWPWLLAGATAEAPGLAELIGSRPIPVHWVGQPPSGLPGRPVVHPDWTELVGALERLRALSAQGVNGVRLLRNRGLQTPDGRIVLDVFNVEGLLASPGGLALPANGSAEQAVEALRAEIATHRLPLRLDRTGNVLRLS
jgi:hypothetical protein